MKKTAWKRYLIATLICLAISLLLLLARGSFAKEIWAERYKDFSDAFFVPAIMMISIGGLLFVAQNGTFDMVKFGVMKAVSMMRSEKHRNETQRTYYDYKQAQAEKPPSAYGYLLLIGAVFMVLAVFFAFL